MPNGDFAGELLRANYARLSNTFHIKTHRPAQLPNRQRVSVKNQVPNFTGSGTEILCEIWRSHVLRCGGHCLHAENGIVTAGRVLFHSLSIIIPIMINKQGPSDISVRC